MVACTRIRKTMTVPLVSGCEFNPNVSALVDTLSIRISKFIRSPSTTSWRSTDTRATPATR